jgi:hypothetical protein
MGSVTMGSVSLRATFPNGQVLFAGTYYCISKMLLILGTTGAILRAGQDATMPNASFF